MRRHKTLRFDYRVNYGNGTVSNGYIDKAHAQRHLDEMDQYREFAFIEKYRGDGEWSRVRATKPRLTRDQKKALDEYNFRLREEDRYLGSVFANAQGQRDHEAKTLAAYEKCKRLGMTHEHGL